MLAGCGGESRSAVAAVVPVLADGAGKPRSRSVRCLEAGRGPAVLPSAERRGGQARPGERPVGGDGRGGSCLRFSPLGTAAAPSVALGFPGAGGRSRLFHWVSLRGGRGAFKSRGEGEVRRHSRLHRQRARRCPPRRGTGGSRSASCGPGRSRPSASEPARGGESSVGAGCPPTPAPADGGRWPRRPMREGCWRAAARR